MVGSIGQTNNLINMISLSYQRTTTARQESARSGSTPPPPPPPPNDNVDDSYKHERDPLGVFSTVDADGDNTISMNEYSILTEGITAVTGKTLDNSFQDFDTDGDGVLNASELRSVLDEAGFEPPPPPEKVIAAYNAQSGENALYPAENEDMLAELLDYLKNKSNDFETVA